MDKLDAEIGLKQELQNLEDEREDVLMRIEDIGVEMEQTAEPEGGPIADELGGRLMTAEKELRAINSKMIDIKDDLGYFRMYESDLDEGTCGYGEDGVIGDKPAGPNMEEDLEVDIETDPNKERLKVKIPGDFSDNEGEAAVKKELEKQKKIFKSFSVKDIKELPEDINLDEELFTPNEIGDEAVEKESNSSAYESLRESLRKNLRKRLS